MLPFATSATAPAASTYPLTCHKFGNCFVMPNLSSDATTGISTVMHVIVTTSPPLLYALTKNQSPVAYSKPNPSASRRNVPVGKLNDGSSVLTNWRIPTAEIQITDAYKIITVSAFTFENFNSSSTLQTA